jgi:hypothetical protein
MNHKDNKTPNPPAAAAAPTAAVAASAGAGAGAGAVAGGGAELKSSYRRFNERMKVFLTDMESVYGKKSKALGETKRQLETFLQTDPARMRIAHLAWPLFNRHRILIDKRDPDVFFKYDLAGLQAKGKLDVKAIWATASANSREAMWRAVEDLLDLLDEINGIRPIPKEDDDDDADLAEQKKNPNYPLPMKFWYEALDRMVPISSLPPIAEEGPAQWTRALMSNLKDIIGPGDASVEEDFEALISKLTNEPEEGKTTAADQETMTRILHHFIDKISPASMAEEDNMEGMSEQEKKAEMALRSMQEIQLRNELKYAIGKLTDIESLQQTSDPTILENERQEMAAEAERMKNPEMNREYTITAHFNQKLLLLLQKLHTVRGTIKSKKDGRVLFPGLRNSFVELLTMFKENPATEAVIRPVGEWVVTNRQRLLNRDDKLFLEPSHPFLIEMNAATLWSTFKPHERVNFWTLVGHPLQLATIFHHLDDDGLRDIADIVNDLLAAGKIAYDRDPNTLNGKQVITKAIKRGCTTNKIAKIKGLFERMQKEKDQKTLKSLARLMQDVLPQAAGLRSGKNHNDDDAEAESTESADDGSEAKAMHERAQQFQNTFQKILASMPPLAPLVDSKKSNDQKDSKTPIGTTAPKVTTSASSVSAAASAPVDPISLQDTQATVPMSSNSAPPPSSATPKD